MEKRSLIVVWDGIFSLLFIIPNSFLPLFFYNWRELGPLIPVFITAFSIFFLEIVRVVYQKPEIRILKIGHPNFENSIRIYAKVENRGRTVARYVKPLLTIKDERLSQLVCAERSNDKWEICKKGGFSCTICNEGFLCPYPFKVEKNYLLLGGARG